MSFTVDHRERGSVEAHPSVVSQSHESHHHHHHQPPCEITVRDRDASALGGNNFRQVHESDNDETLVHGCSCIIWHIKTHILDWLVAIAIGILALLITLLIRNHRQLFDPNDPRINYPHLDSTFPDWCVPILSIVLPLVIIITFAVFNRKHGATMLARHQLGRHVYGLILANTLVIFVTQAMKAGTGRPRPNCLALGQYYNGTFNAPTLTIDNAFASFPSGHSSITCTGMVFLYQYLLSELFCEETSVRRNQVWRSMICLLPVGLAIWVMISRITDYWHDPGDVIAGGLLGTSIGFFVYRAHSALPSHRDIQSGLGEVPNYSTIPRQRGSLERVSEKV